MEKVIEVKFISFFIDICVNISGSFRFLFPRGSIGTP